MASSSSSSPELSAAPSASQSQEYASVHYEHLSRDEVLEDLSSRFILNLPDEELTSVERVCFQVEQAHWYYEDFIREQNPSKFPTYTLKTFSEALFHACPLLAHWAQDHDEAFGSFMKYKTRVPVCGAIMLNDTWDKCVLVKGWKSSAGWGFPKGKINEQEPKHRCAIREVLEETGYNLEDQLNRENVIQMSIKEQSISLYIVPGVPEDFPFKTRTRKEISKIAWFRLSDLPTWKRNRTAPGKFYLITPFIGPLKAFIHDRKPRGHPRKALKSHVPKVKEEHHLSGEEDGAAANDQSSASNAQELSSQASSAEPQTPSPQYSAARVHQSTFEESISSDTTDPARQMLNMEVGDPHLANLLSGLQRSAASLALDNTHAAQTKSAAPEVRSTPAPSHPISAPADSPDWSASVPAKVTSPLGQLSHAQSLPALPPHSYHRVQSGPSFESRNKVAASAPSLQPPPAGAGHARRTSTADISPYLSHARNIPKEMRYISILESVAQESERTTSRMGHRSPMAPLQPMYPPPPTSVPHHPATSDQSVIYSSTPVPPLGQHTMYQTQAPDVFMGRPRTSHAIHHAAYSAAGVPRQSMNEHQLRALLPLNGPWSHGSMPSVLPPYSIQAPPNQLRPPPHQLLTSTAHHNALRATNNAQLLSILNTPNPIFRA